MADQQNNVLTDHAYDGIQEYDNPMPGWWVWGFILTIIFAFPYWAWFHLSEGKGIYAELEADVARAEALAPKLEETKEAMVGYLDDEDILARGANLFAGNCALCHTADGGGLVGPNLTDDYYNNVKSIEDILTIVRKGLVEKGMPPHEGTMRQQEIVQVATYAASLRGTTPANPLPPLGEIIPAWR